MLEQLEMYAEQAMLREAKIKKAQWDAMFQKWCDDMSHDGSTEQGKCGWGVFCDYCDDVSHGKPCVRAINAMLRETGKNIDYKHADFERIWRGLFDTEEITDGLD